MGDLQFDAEPLTEQIRFDIAPLCTAAAMKMTLANVPGEDIEAVLRLPKELAISEDGDVLLTDTALARAYLGLKFGSPRHPMTEIEDVILEILGKALEDYVLPED